MIKTRDDMFLTLRTPVRMYHVNNEKEKKIQYNVAFASMEIIFSRTGI